MSATKQSHIEALATFVEKIRPDRLYAVLTETNMLCVKPWVMSKIDSVRMRGVTPENWAKVRERLNGAGLIVLQADDYNFSEDRATSD